MSILAVRQNRRQTPTVLGPPLVAGPLRFGWADECVRPSTIVADERFSGICDRESWRRSHRSLRIFPAIVAAKISWQIDLGDDNAVGLRNHLDEIPSPASN